MQVAQPPYKVTYNNKNITNDISGNLIALIYHDKEDGSADDLQLHLEDTESLWKNGWYPDKGAVMEAWIGKSVTGELVSCGKFMIDEVVFTGPPSVVAIKCISSYITKKLKTKRSKAHENKTLKDVVDHYAQQHGLKVVGQIENIQLNRVTQYRKGDMQFLHSLAATYGYLFTVKGEQMVFTKVTDIDKIAGKFTIKRIDLTHYDIKDKSSNTFASASNNYHSPVDHNVIKAEVQKNLDNIAFTAEIKEQLQTQTVSDNVLQMYKKVETQAQADAVATGALYQANRDTVTGTFEMPGRPEACAGNNFKLEEYYKLNGLWHITESIHKVDRRSGYVTNLVATKVGAGKNTGPGRVDKKVIPSSSSTGGAVGNRQFFERNLA